MRIYGETIIHYIAHVADSGKICQELGLCGSTDHAHVEILSDDYVETRAKRSTNLLGKKKCTWGPSYWCENMEQANECHVRVYVYFLLVVTIEHKLILHSSFTFGKLWDFRIRVYSVE
jgi:hypothetical protein